MNNIRVRSFLVISMLLMAFQGAIAQEHSTNIAVVIENKLPTCVLDFSSKTVELGNFKSSSTPSVLQPFSFAVRCDGPVKVGLKWYLVGGAKFNQCSGCTPENLALFIDGKDVPRDPFRLALRHLNLGREDHVFFDGSRINWAADTSREHHFLFQPLVSVGAANIKGRIRVLTRVSVVYQ